jgi:hypothetical protein
MGKSIKDAAHELGFPLIFGVVPPIVQLTSKVGKGIEDHIEQVGKVGFADREDILLRNVRKFRNRHEEILPSMPPVTVFEAGSTLHDGIADVNQRHSIGIKKLRQLVLLQLLCPCRVPLFEPMYLAADSLHRERNGATGGAKSIREALSRKKAILGFFNLVKEKLGLLDLVFDDALSNAPYLITPIIPISMDCQAHQSKLKAKT